MIGKLIAAACALALHTSTAGAQVVAVEQGRLHGVDRGRSVAYLGVPYAAPPVGQLRWRPPIPALRWSGVRNASSFAPACMQRGVSMPGETPPTTSEDCLYLNVWTPRRIGRRAPVMVWIHGGGYANGSTAMPLYAGDNLARRGVVVVSIAYRLGPFGFLAHPELTAEGGGSSGNYGLRDQIAALTWVKRNIAAFGGDPNNVTVFGQSAGAMSISLLMTSPQARGLFERAIAQSGGVFEPLQLAPQYLLANAEHDGVRYAASLGANSIAALRALPADRLLDGEAGRVSHPVIEPVVLPRAPYDAYLAHHFADVPLIVGVNAEEGRSLVDVSGVTAANYAAGIRDTWGELPPALSGAYPFTTDAEAQQARVAFETDLRFGWDMWAWARLHAQEASHSVYYYQFAQRPPFPSGNVRFGWGASHFAELWYMFDHLDQEAWAWSAADRATANAMASYWTSFARTGDPNEAHQAPWPRFVNDHPQVLELGRSSALVAPLTPQLRVFDSVYAAVRGRPFGSREE
ncbi:MAG: carboxylesterase family protein [Proteobacteria bacterium]|nr:carboxylesterase family protein [Pseudomonadota bacterium]